MPADLAVEVQNGVFQMEIIPRPYEYVARDQLVSFGG